MSDALIEAVAKAILDARYQRDNDRLNLNMAWDALNDKAHEVYIAQARAALAAIEASGTHVVVPVEMTDAMEAAAMQSGFEGESHHLERDYAAMLAARPKVLE